LRASFCQEFLCAYLEGHLDLYLEQLLGSFVVAFYSGSGLWPAFVPRVFAGWLFIRDSFLDLRGDLLYGPSRLKGGGEVTSGVYRVKVPGAVFKEVESHRFKVFLPDWEQSKQSVAG